MAPALTSEVTTRGRQGIAEASGPPTTQICGLVNGQTLEVHQSDQPCSQTCSLVSLNADRSLKTNQPKGLITTNGLGTSTSYSNGNRIPKSAGIDITVLNPKLEPVVFRSKYPRPSRLALSTDMNSPADHSQLGRKKPAVTFSSSLSSSSSFSSVSLTMAPLPQSTSSDTSHQQGTLENQTGLVLPLTRVVSTGGQVASSQSRIIMSLQSELHTLTSSTSTIPRPTAQLLSTSLSQTVPMPSSSILGPAPKMSVKQSAGNSALQVSGKLQSSAVVKRSSLLTSRDQSKSSELGTQSDTKSPPLTNGINCLGHRSQTTGGTTATSSVSNSSSTSLGYKVAEGHISGSQNPHDNLRILVPNAVSTSRHQRELEMQVARLMRRIRRLQCRQSISHVKQQLSGFVEHEKSKTLTNSSSYGDLKSSELLPNKDMKHMSTAALVSLVQKLQSNNQSSSTHQPPLLSLSQEQASDTYTHLGEEHCQELDRAVGHLESNLGHLHNMADSDATESSSGGESCDEMEYSDNWDGKTSRPSM